MYYNNSGEYNDCVAHGACSLSPDVSSLQEILFILLKQTAYYLKLLIKFDDRRKDIIEEVIYYTAFSDSVKDLTEKQILDAFSELYNNLILCRKKYIEVCKIKGIPYTDIPKIIKLTPQSSLSNLLKLGEKEFQNKYKKTSSDKKFFAEILIAIMKSVSVNIVMLKDLSYKDNKYIDKILDSLDMFNKQRISAEKIKAQIDKLAAVNLELFKQINILRTKKFGKISETNVSCSTTPAKAIMVSGNDLSDLDNLLKSVQSTDIDVYTNGNLLIAHTFEYFKKFHNLKGHFGNGIANTMLDFATFPGAILLTKNEAQNIEYLYRGRLFTTDKITPKGVSRIEKNNFIPIIESALSAKGFAKGQKRDEKTVGYNDEKLYNQLNKILSANPKHIHVVGISDLRNDIINIFKSFFDKLPDDEYAISFSYNPNKKNVINIDLGADYPLLYDVLNKIFSIISIDADNISFYISKCDANSLSNIVNLKNKGAKNIYLSSCSPLSINPAMLKVFKKLYNIKEM